MREALSSKKSRGSERRPGTWVYSEREREKKEPCKKALQRRKYGGQGKGRRRVSVKYKGGASRGSTVENQGTNKGVGAILRNEPRARVGTKNAERGWGFHGAKLSWERGGSVEVAVHSREAGSYSVDRSPRRRVWWRWPIVGGYI